MDRDEQGLRSVKTYLCALVLAPLAFPPDLPPVILMVLDELVVMGEVMDLAGVMDAECRFVVDGWRLDEEKERNED